MEETLENKIVPPYLSVAKLDKLFNLLSTHSLSEVTASGLLSRGFSKQDSFLAVQTLKFLSLLTSDGKTTDNARLFAMKGPEKSESLQNLFRQSYKKMFDTVSNAEKLTRNELHDEFMANYKISQRLAAPAALSFLWLSGKFGLETSEEVISRPRSKSGLNTGIHRKPNIELPLQATKNNMRPIAPDEGYFDMNISDTGIKVRFPKDEKIEDAIVSGDFSDARLKIIDFAKKVGLVKQITIDGVESKQV